MAESYVPTDSMASNARRGLALRDEFNRGGTSVGITDEETSDNTFAKKNVDSFTSCNTDKTKVFS
jgi:hypothetical protein